MTANAIFLGLDTASARPSLGGAHPLAKLSVEANSERNRRLSGECWIDGFCLDRGAAEVQIGGLLAPSNG